MFAHKYSILGPFYVDVSILYANTTMWQQCGWMESITNKHTGGE